MDENLLAEVAESMMAIEKSVGVFALTGTISFLESYHTP
jgi:hypothetical protein